LSDDLSKIEHHDIWDVSVVATYVDGKPVYEKDVWQ